MTFLRLAPLALFFLATSLLSMKHIEAGACFGFCEVTETEPCGSKICLCVSFALITGICVPPFAVESYAKRLDEYPNLCLSHHDCVKKGSGNFCARSPNPNVPFGWCSHSNTEALKGFLAMPEAITK
ncbi:unnamed protein product [Sphenostylis stenocarpa]|uniref:Albumin I chain a domain-containing protein n=1 Tax=Sphenostylis stenocarpa TaxID=92480 RepID=A0AA87BAA1_9FABA|nr:unnamed protein product [Sphenostylis stenocarpa]